MVFLMISMLSFGQKSDKIDLKLPKPQKFSLNQSLDDSNRMTVAQLAAVTGLFCITASMFENKYKQQSNQIILGVGVGLSITSWLLVIHK